MTPTLTPTRPTRPEPTVRGHAGREPIEVLRAARDEQRAVDAGQVRVLEHVLAWALANPEPFSEGEAFGWDMPGGADLARLGGEGCPGVAVSSVAEIALALNLTTDAGKQLVSDVLALAFRLPATWERVLAGEVAVWRARKLAQATHALPLAAAEFVDRQVAPFAHRLSGAQTDRMVQTAMAEHDPAQAEADRIAALDDRFVHLGLEHAGLNGTVTLHGELDLVDALDLEGALQIGAAHLRDLGSTDPLGVRRSITLGDLARNQPALPIPSRITVPGGGEPFGTHELPADLPDLDPEQPTAAQRWASGPDAAGRGAVGEVAFSGSTATDEDLAPGQAATGDVTPAPTGDGGARAGWPIMLYLHLTAGHIVSAPPAGHSRAGSGSASGVGWCDTTRSAVTAGQIRAWLGAPGAKITVRPVIDTREVFTSGGYVPAPVLDEQVRLRDRVCVFPGCTRPASTADLDHTIPWAQDGPTTSDNLAALCRGHHNLKTHHGWRYVRDPDGSILWTTPAGHRYRSHSHGGWHPVTTDGHLTDDPDPP